ncbi:MAG: hypothetical protein ACRDX9_10125 [Acidimicrobiia bacterium]
MPKDETPDIVEAAGLFSLPLDQFTAARDGLVRDLRSDGDEEEAKRVGKLRKPSVAAWALNQAARHHPEIVDQLLDSHQRLRSAGSRESLEEASKLRRKTVTDLTESAMAELGGGSLQTRDRINRTLLAVATDPQGEADLKAGILVRELEPSGIGWGDTELPPPPAPDPGQEAALAAEKARELARKLEAEAVAADEQLESAKQALTEARSRAKSARAAADKAAKEAEEAEAAEEAARG